VVERELCHKGKETLSQLGEEISGLKKSARKSWGSRRLEGEGLRFWPRKKEITYICLGGGGHG